MMNLTIKIQDISEGKRKAFMATLVELNNSKICADTLPEIFELIPEVLKSAEQHQIGVFSSLFKNHQKKAFSSKS